MSSDGDQRASAEAVDLDASDPEATGSSVTDRALPVLVLQVFAITLFVFPSNSVIRAVGANGYVASLVGLMALGLWAFWVAVGRQNLLARRNPIRVGFGMLWVSSLISYALMTMSPQPGGVQLAADRWLLQLGMMTGVAFIAIDGLRTRQGLAKVARSMVLAASFCATIAVIQFALRQDLSPYLRMLPGFTLNGEWASISSRDSLNRVAGTALHPIEMGVAMAMVLPLALWLARFDTRGVRWWRRWGPSALIVVGAVVSVSRSAVVGVIVALALLLVLIPVRERSVAFLIAPVVLVGVFLAVPRYISTIAEFFVAGSSGRDASVAARTDDYALVASQVADYPLFGQGPGHFVPQDMFQILDNQYLATAIDLGLVGLVSLVTLLLLPAITAIRVRSRTSDPQIRWLCSALASSALASAVCAFTFDSFSFPIYVGVQSLIAGLVGACWAQEHARSHVTDPPPAEDVGTPDEISAEACEPRAITQGPIDGQVSIASSDHE